MTFLYLLTLCLAGDPTPTEPPATNLPGWVKDVTIDAARTNARGEQIISVRVKMHPKCAIGSGALKLTITTRDPKTQVHVIYPSGHMDDGARKCYRDEIAIQVLILRAEGDQSPVQGRLDFRIAPLLREKSVVIADGSERTYPYLV